MTSSMISEEMRLVKHWQLAHGKVLEIGSRALLMGILNVTPDSFSDGGSSADVETALAKANDLLAEGADIIDIGGESTRPNAEPVSAQIEQARILPVIRALRENTDAIISVDTYRAETAYLAVQAGAHIINDVWGLQREKHIAVIAKETGAGLVIMHTGRDRQKLEDPIADQFFFLEKSLQIAADAGIPTAQIMLDPGFGFAKDQYEDIELIARFSSLQAFDYPWLVGTSRKRFIGGVTGIELPQERDVATSATSVALRLAGADVFRVHNVTINKQALAIADAILQSKR